MTRTTRHRLREARDRLPTQRGASAPSALAMRIALAHYVERKVEEGTLASYADAAARLGITRARMTQVMDLLLMQASKLEIDIGAGLRKEPTRSHQTSRAQSPSPH